MIKIRSWYGHSTEDRSIRYKEDHVFESADEIDTIEPWSSKRFRTIKSKVEYKDQDGREMSVYSDETPEEIKAKIAKEVSHAATND